MTSWSGHLGPPQELDPSAKSGTPVGLFAPIWEIDSFDVFAKGPAVVSQVTTEIDVASLFSLSRPYWGAMLERQTITEARSLARIKIFSGRPSDGASNEIVSLALLSYRMQFYVISHSLAEDLTSGYL